MEIRKPNLSSAAVILKQRMAAKGIEISHSEALEHAAAMEGFQSFQAHQQYHRGLAQLEHPVLELEQASKSSRDYRYIGKRGEGVWVRMRNISVYLKADDEGVVVDLFNSGMEGEGSVASTYQLYQDSTSDQLETAEHFFDMRQHMRSLLSTEGAFVKHVEGSPDEWMWKWKRQIRGPFSSEDEATKDAFAYVFQ